MGAEAIREKLKWTQHHFDILDEAVSTYVDPDNINFRPKRYDDVQKLAWGNLESTLDPTVPIVIAHIFGDLLQSANSCLDYLVCELYLRHHPGEEARPSHKFPLATSHGAFNKEIGSDALYGIPFDAIAVIEGLQPYEGRTDPVPMRLLQLRNLTNTHKHRNLHISVLTACPIPSDPSVIREVDGEYFVLGRDLPKAMHFKAELGPFSVTQDGQVNVNREFAAMVVLKENKFRDEPLTYLAEEFCRAVAVTCEKLTPFFA